MAEQEQEQERWSAVDHYLSGVLVEQDPAMTAALEASEAAGLPAIAVAPNQGKLLSLLAQVQGARTVLEIGTLGGYSTLWLVRGLPPEGRVVTLEAEAKHAEVARANFRRAGLTERIELRLGPAAETLAALVGEGAGPFDFIFIDADKESCAEYFGWSLRLARVGTLIVADNVVQKGNVIDEQSDDTRVQGMRRFLAAVAAEPRVQATAIQTVGSKGYDGFALMRVVG